MIKNTKENLCYVDCIVNTFKRFLGVCLSFLRSWLCISPHICRLVLLKVN